MGAFLKVIVVLIIIAVVGVGGYFGYRYYTTSTSSTTNPSPPPPDDNSSSPHANVPNAQTLPPAPDAPKPKCNRSLCNEWIMNKIAAPWHSFSTPDSPLCNDCPYLMFDASTQQLHGNVEQSCVPPWVTELWETGRGKCLDYINGQT